MTSQVKYATLASRRWRLGNLGAAHWQGIGLAGLLLVLFMAALATGAVAIPSRQVLAILLSPWLGAGEFEPSQAHVLLAIRLPRVLMGALIGAALATAGAALQGLMRNPLADAGLIGVSSGAALFVVGFLVLGLNIAPALTQHLGHFALGTLLSAFPPIFSFFRLSSLTTRQAAAASAPMAYAPLEE